MPASRLLIAMGMVARIDPNLIPTRHLKTIVQIPLECALYNYRCLQGNYGQEIIIVNATYGGRATAG